MDVVGEAFLSAVLEVALGQLASLLREKFRRWSSVEKDLKKLMTTLSYIQAVLNDAEKKQMSNTSVKMWLSDLRDAAYDMEDVLDEVSIKAHPSKLETQVRNLFRRPKKLKFKYQLASKIKNITHRLDDIAKLKDDLGLTECVVEGKRTQLVTTPVSQETTSFINESCVFGRIDDRKKMVESLLSANDDYSVIPIVGMGGLGKSTLAKLVYNHERVVKYFDLRMWICVSVDFDVLKISKSMVESATGNTCHLSVLDVVQRRLGEILRGKRFLLVLDDVWSENNSDWESVNPPFSTGAKGSKIIVTTRSQRVSLIMGTTTTHRLGGLSEDDCWSLFRQSAFRGDSSDAYPNLVAIGKKIVKKCKGLPLAAKTLGGMLHSKLDPVEWDMILKSDIWDLKDDDNGILPALILSYNHLPSHLRRCFAYCSIFPKDYEFEKENLVLKWIAEGFVQSERGKSMEEVGRNYFDDLLVRSFFQYSNFDKSQFVMHDLIHGLAQVVSGEICFKMEGDKPHNIPEKARHASLLLHTFKSITFEVFPSSRILRTFILLSDKHMYPTLPKVLDFIVTLTCLRTLDMSHVSMTELPDTVGNLKHLRYLDLTNTDIERLPKTISDLYHLRILILRGCKKLLELPTESRNLVNLVHLDLIGCSSLVYMPHGVGNLTCLQTLNRFVVSKESGCSGIGEMKNMMHIRGALQIERLENVVNVTEAKDANLKDKLYLKKLVLEWRRRLYSPDGIDEGVLEGLQPPTDLNDLMISSYHGIKFPSWVGDSSFSHLVEVKLFDCSHCKLLPPLGQLPVLKHLNVTAMHGLERVGHEFCSDRNSKGFPLLESLKFEDMVHLKEWVGVEDGEFPCLRKLVIKNCPEMTTLPRFPSLSDLYLQGCHEMIIKSLPYLTSLSSLKISFFERLLTLELRELVSLHRLEIFYCPKLMDFQDHGLPTTLRHFLVDGCHSLKSLPMGLKHLSSLERLDILSCPKLISFPAEELPSGLKHLQISECENLQSLPMELKCLTSLEHLRIESCNRLDWLPEDWLPTGLKRLRISDCANLKSPPMGLQSLTSLEDVEIQFCNLKNAYQMRG